MTSFRDQKGIFYNVKDAQLSYRKTSIFYNVKDAQLSYRKTSIEEKRNGCFKINLYSLNPLSISMNTRFRGKYLTITKNHPRHQTLQTNQA